MNRFRIAIEYLTGYAVATDPSNREKAEWPPHPARVFMALAAAHFETNATSQDKQADRDALEWLASLPSPEMVLPDHAPERAALTVYVPVNDATGLDVLPSKRSRQPRLFPRVYIGDEPIQLIWSAKPTDIALHMPALQSVCRNVTRIGHSSSLVWARAELADDSASTTHIPDEHALGHQLRIAEAGTLARLEQAFNASNITSFADLQERIDGSKGKGKKELQSERTQRFPLGEPVSQRPSISLSRSYVRVTTPTPDTAHSHFDPQLIVLRETDGSPQSLGVESTLLVTNALRNLIFKESAVQPVPDWLSGHDSTTGEKLANGKGHMAIVPLPFIGREHADGHLLGVALVLPRDLPARERANVLGRVLFDPATNEPRVLRLTLGRAGEFWLERDTSYSEKYNLQPATWTGPHSTWASATPVVLDRMPKSDRAKEQLAWRAEVSEIVAKSCVNVGLPAPVGIRVEKTPSFRGSLRAMPGQGGFPVLRQGVFQVHVEIDFGIPVHGPVLIGAGRFRGYGLCRPFNPGGFQ